MIPESKPFPCSVRSPHPQANMAAPPATADTAAPPPPPPAEPVAAAIAEQKVSHTPPLTPPQPDAPPPPPPAAKKRKLEDAGFHASAYYEIRATVADLRLRFVQVYEAADFRNNDAAREILKEIKVVMELSKKMRFDLCASANSEPVKPSCKPLAGTVKDGLAELIPSGEKSPVPQTGQAAISPNNLNDGAQPKSDNFGSTAEKMLEETQSSEMADQPKQLDEIAQGAHVTGGSPVGWNFLVWPGGSVVYYGLSKVEFRARQAAV